MNHRVLLNGKPLYFLEEPDGSGPLAPPEHMFDGELRLDAALGALGPSYAHVMPDGSIMRFGSKIGTRKDLVFVDVIEGTAREVPPQLKGAA
uniref:Uncharacterized protein n=1 Tax=Eiseniibacteriota bacterium TaxID=2212470 RepID=A0A832MJE7_UNCEI